MIKLPKHGRISYFNYFKLNKNPVKICYFGIYNSEYSRNKVIINGLRENEVKVKECKEKPKGFLKNWRLFRKLQREDYDMIIVGFPGQTVVWLAKLFSLFNRKKVVFDAFFSIYDFNVFDRKLCSEKSFKARYYWFLDWFSCKLADKILLDTQEHINYFAEEFRIEKEKFYKLFISADDKVMCPRLVKENRNYFLVNFHGKFIPLQGIEYIIQAAKILENENIKFNIIGTGQTYSKIKELANKLQVKNINFIGFLNLKKVAEYINKADISLGIFGSTQKAQRVIPNKVYEALACRKAVITGETPAAKELFTDKENILFCKMADSKDLAQKILELKNDSELRNKIAENGYKLFKQKLTPKVLGKEFKEFLIKELNENRSYKENN